MAATRSGLSDPEAEVASPTLVITLFGTATQEGLEWGRGGREGGRV